MTVEKEQTQRKPPVRTGSPLGHLTDAEQQRAFTVASQMGGYDPNMSAQNQLKLALQNQDINALRQTFEANPQMLKGNPFAMDRLRKSPFFQEHKQELLTALGQMEGGAQLTQERRDLLSQLKGIEPQHAEHAAANTPRLEGSRVAQAQRHNTI